MIVVTDEVKDGILFFERIFQIVLALAIGEAFKQYFPERKAEGHRTVLLDSTPALIAFIILIVTFYLGMDRYFWRSYINPHAMSDHYAAHLMFDSVLFMLESALFFSMSRNLHQDRWKTFYLLIAVLLLVDIVWCVHGTLLGPDSFVGWIEWDCLFLVCIGALRYVSPREGLAAWIGLSMTFIITLCSYLLFWRLYFA